MQREEPAIVQTIYQAQHGAANKLSNRLFPPIKTNYRYIKYNKIRTFCKAVRKVSVYLNCQTQSS